MMGFMLACVTFISILFSQMMSPMLLSFLVVSCGVAVMFFLGVLLPLFWFSYVVLLVFLGGLLVIFVYVSSLCPNEPVMRLGGWVWLIVGLMGILGGGWWSGVDLVYAGGGEDMIWLMKMYDSGVGVLITMLVVYLLLVMLVVVDSSLVFEGSLSVN
nr:NADH dehydrogenase subunit 6 [Polydesmus sp. GZCS-2019]